jgi:hypothetical protein
MDKKPSFLWALAIGLAFPVLQVIIFLIRFGRFDTQAPWTDYLLFFLGGAFSGAGLIYFLRRSETRAVSRAVIIAFVLSLPFALFGMVVGGVIGMVGALILGVSPSIFITGVGYFLGRILSRKRATA